MRLSATRARFPLIPNSPDRRTRWETGSSGGSSPSRALASTDRAVSGVAPSSPPDGPATPPSGPGIITPLHQLILCCNIAA